MNVSRQIWGLFPPSAIMLFYYYIVIIMANINMLLSIDFNGKTALINVRALKG